MPPVFAIYFQSTHESNMLAPESATYRAEVRVPSVLLENNGQRITCSHMRRTGTRAVRQTTKGTLTTVLCPSVTPSTLQILEGVMPTGNGPTQRTAPWIRIPCANNSETKARVLKPLEPLQKYLPSATQTPPLPFTIISANANELVNAGEIELSTWVERSVCCKI